MKGREEMEVELQEVMSGIKVSSDNPKVQEYVEQNMADYKSVIPADKLIRLLEQAVWHVRKQLSCSLKRPVLLAWGFLAGFFGLSSLGKLSSRSFFVKSLSGEFNDLYL